MDYHFNQQELLRNIGINERTTISLFKAQHNITIKTVTNIDYTNQNRVYCEPIQNCSLICNKNEPWPYDFSHDNNNNRDTKPLNKCTHENRRKKKKTRPRYPSIAKGIKECKSQNQIT